MQFSAEELDQYCRQAIIDNSRWINQWLGRPFVLPHIHGNLGDQIQGFSGLQSLSTYAEVKAKVAQAHLQGCQYCYTHNGMCSTNRPVHIDFSGLPCEDNSRANQKRAYFEGRYGKLYPIWARMHKTRRTPLVILENSPETRLRAVLVILA